MVDSFIVETYRRQTLHDSDDEIEDKEKKIYGRKRIQVKLAGKPRN